MKYKHIPLCWNITKIHNPGERQNWYP